MDVTFSDTKAIGDEFIKNKVEAITQAKTKLASGVRGAARLSVGLAVKGARTAKNSAQLFGGLLFKPIYFAIGSQMKLLGSGLKVLGTKANLVGTVLKSTGIALKSGGLIPCNNSLTNKIDSMANKFNSIAIDFGTDTNTRSQSPLNTIQNVESRNDLASTKPVFQQPNLQLSVGNVLPPVRQILRSSAGNTLPLFRQVLQSSAGNVLPLFRQVLPLRNVLRSPVKNNALPLNVVPTAYVKQQSNDNQMVN